MKIFVLGAVTDTNKEDQNKFTVYEKVLKVIYPESEIILPNTIWDFRQNYIKKNPNASLVQINKAMVDYDLEQVRTAELLVGDLSIKSTGMGIELGTALAVGIKKMVFFANKTATVSNMVLGAFPNIKVIPYLNNEDLEKKIKKWFSFNTN